MNKFEVSLERIKKQVEIDDSWTKEDFDHYTTIVDALEISSSLLRCSNDE